MFGGSGGAGNGLARRVTCVWWSGLVSGRSGGTGELGGGCCDLEQLGRVSLGFGKGYSRGVVSDW